MRPASLFGAGPFAPCRARSAGATRRSITTSSILGRLEMVDRRVGTGKHQADMSVV